MDEKFILRVLGCVSHLDSEFNLTAEKAAYLSQSWGMSRRNVRRYAKATKQALTLLREEGISVHIFKEKADDTKSSPGPIVLHPTDLGGTAAPEAADQLLQPGGDQ